MPREWIWFVLAVVFGAIVGLAWMAQRLIDETKRLLDGMGSE
jgi:hypothetical protein